MWLEEGKTLRFIRYWECLVTDPVHSRHFQEKQKLFHFLKEKSQSKFNEE